jgi:hypothetical protein
MPVTDALQFFPSPAAFRTWLQTHAATAPELLVGYYKVATGRSSMNYWSETDAERTTAGLPDSRR